MSGQFCDTLAVALDKELPAPTERSAPPSVCMLWRTGKASVLAGHQTTVPWSFSPALPTENACELSVSEVSLCPKHCAHAPQQVITYSLCITSFKSHFLNTIQKRYKIKTNNIGS